MVSNSLSTLRGADSKPPICHPSPQPPPGFCSGHITPAFAIVAAPGIATGILKIAYTDDPTIGQAQITWIPDFGQVTAPPFGNPGEEVVWDWDPEGHMGTLQLTVIYQLYQHPPCIYWSRITFVPAG